VLFPNVFVPRLQARAGVPTERTRGRPLSGAGLGLSAIDGLVRVDVSRGLAPVRAAWRVDVTFDARF